MGRSRVAGCRSKVRGAVGDVIYQISKDADGVNQQVVYARQRERVNNNTPAQARARMIMGQVQRMFHILPEVISGAFATIPRGAESFWHFAKMNHALLSDDFDTNFNTYGRFDWRPKYDMSAPAGIWKLTDGLLPEIEPDQISVSPAASYELDFSFRMASQDATLGDLLDRLGMQLGDTLYVLIYRKDSPDYVPSIEVCQFYVPRSLDPATPLNEWGDDESPFEYRAPALEGRTVFDMSNDFTFLIGDWSDDSTLVIACVAFIVYRPTDSFPLFSSSSFRWYLSNYWRLFDCKTINETYETWQQTNSTNE